MSHMMSNFGIVVEQSKKQISIFNTDTLKVLHILKFLNLSPIALSDVVIAPDCKSAVVTNRSDRNFIKIDLSKEPPTYMLSPKIESDIGDIDITPDGSYALSTSGFNPNSIILYNIKKNIIVDEIPSDSSSIAVSPDCKNTLIAALSFVNDTLKCFTLEDGRLIKNEEATFCKGSFPINLSFTPDGKYAFVANLISKSIDIFKIEDNKIISHRSVNTKSSPQTIAVSSDGKSVYVLTSDVSFENEGFVEIFDFNNGELTYASPISIFPTGIYIRSSVGIEQMALDFIETKLFIIGSKTSLYDSSVLRVFKINGQKIGDIKGISAEGGIDTNRTIPFISRGIPFIYWADLT